MEESSEVMENMIFRGVEFTVKIQVDKGALLVEISDSKTADQWKEEFDPPYIEDLTRKTGNFKQFPIFCSMLESAVRKTSDSVTLDLLTYADLELLRNRKAGVVGRPRGHAQSSALTAKRYLILIYTVEFDRIHYPLPLPYIGKPDPAALQKEIGNLRAELCALTSRGVGESAELEIRRLRAELALMKEEKDAIAKVLERLQPGRTPAIPAGPPERRARDAVRSLEEQLLKERAKSQHSASKRCREQRLLVEQLEQLRASECALRLHVKSLTNELALLRRRGTPGSGRTDTYGMHNPVRGRSGSRERRGERAPRSTERRTRLDSAGPRRPSPSPTGSRVPRFDPTAYIQDRQRRLRESELKKQLKVRRDLMASPLPERGRSRSREARLRSRASTVRGRSLSAERRGSVNSSESSLLDMEEMTEALLRGRKRTFNGPTTSRGSLLTRKALSSTPTYRTKNKESSTDPGADLSEIDARLQALQECMRDLDTGY
ncbi:centrosomal protein CCDC61 [Stigmatopora nigra]